MIPLAKQSLRHRMQSPRHKIAKKRKSHMKSEFSISGSSLFQDQLFASLSQTSPDTPVSISISNQNLFLSFPDHGCSFEEAVEHYLFSLQTSDPEEPLCTGI